MDNYIEQFIDVGCLRPGELRSGFSGVTLHEKNGGRDEDAGYFARIAFNSKNRNRVFSSHYYVDDKQIIYTLPEDEVALHSTEYANSNTVSITMCRYTDCNTDNLIANTEQLVTDVLMRNNIVLSGDKIFKAGDFSDNDSYEKGLLDSDNNFATISKNVQISLLAKSSEKRTVTQDVIYDRGVQIPTSNDLPYPPANTETESADESELARYRDLGRYTV